MRSERDEIVHITVPLPRDLHTDLKILSRSRKKTIQDLLTNAVELTVKNDEALLASTLIKLFEPKAEDIQISRVDNFLSISWAVGEEKKRYVYDSQTGDLLHREQTTGSSHI